MSRILLLVVLVVSAVAPAAARDGSGRRLLIVPFENTRHEPKLEWLSEAAAVLLADELGSAAISRGARARAFDELHLPISGSLSRATILKVAELVGATDVVIGSFEVGEGGLAVSAHAIDIAVGRLEPAVSERAPLTDLFGIFGRLARRLSPDARTRAATPGHPSLDAFESYIKGLIAERPAIQATFLEMAIQQQPAYEQARLALWDVRTDQDDHAAALAAVKAIPATSPLAPEARFRTALSLVDLKRLDEAFDAFKTLIPPGGGPATTPPAAAAYNNLGIVQLRRGGTPETGSASYYFTKAVEADPDPDYLFNLGYAYALDHNAQGAIYWLREAVRRDTADADAHYVLGAVLLASGSAAEGARERDLARQLASRYEPAADRRAPGDVPRGLERIRTDTDQALQTGAEQTIATSAQRDQREQAAFHFDRARRLFEREEDRDAMAELKRAVYLSPYDAKVHLLIGRIHLRAGRPKEAADALEISVWSDDSAAARIALADAYLKLQKPDAAKAELVRALALDPASAEAKRLLESIK